MISRRCRRLPWTRLKKEEDIVLEFKHEKTLTDGLVGSLGVSSDVLVDLCLRGRTLRQRLVLLVLADELGLQLHDWILDACPGQVFNFSFRCVWRRVVEATIVCCSSSSTAICIDIEGDRTVAVA